MNATEPLIEVADASCRIGRQRLLKIAEFKLFPGQRWCVFGGNGSGKSLLAKLVAGSRTDSGNYVRYGKDFNPKLDIHWVSFEEQQRLWAKDNKLDMSEYSADAADAGTTVDALISSARSHSLLDEELKSFIVSELGLEQLLEKGIRFLSSGQTRKVLLARALYAKRHEACQLIILDDPLETVDDESKDRILKCIETTMSKSSILLQLCRRKSDALDIITHSAFMSNLELVLTGKGSPSSLIEEGLFSVEQPSSLPKIPEKLIEERESGALTNLIELNKVSASYGSHTVFENLSWKMQINDHLLISGPNGCGKSTLLSLINGENHKAYGQEVYIFGKRRGSGETIWDVKSKFGIVSNELHNKYIIGWKVIDVVVSGFFDSVGLYGEATSTQLDEADKWLEAFGLAALSEQLYRYLSFGQQRLILLARAMVKLPRILILDEPCVGLDDFYRDAMLRVVDDIANSTTTQIIFVSHVMDERPLCLNKQLRFSKRSNGQFNLQQGSI